MRVAEPLRDGHWRLARRAETTCVSAIAEFLESYRLMVAPDLPIRADRASCPAECWPRQWRRRHAGASVLWGVIGHC